MNTIQQALNSAQATLQHIEPSDLHYAMQHILGQNLAYIRCHPEMMLSTAQYTQWQEVLHRLSTGEPLAYIVGRRAFWTLELNVSPATLTPRPDTEILVETALACFEAHKQINVLDLGTGSGAIALAIASERSNWQITATDVSKDALVIAQQNAQKHQLDNVHFLHGHWFEALHNYNNTFDLMVSNPPYIDKNDPHLKDLTFEPYSALVADDEGLADLKHIINNASAWLKPAGQLWLEHGYNQGEAVCHALTQAGFTHVKTVQDYGENDRVSGGIATI